MKKFKSFLLLAVIVMAGTVAAFATNAAKNSDDELVTGYYKDSTTGMCKPSPVECSTIDGELCTWKEGSTIHTLYMFNGTNCPLRLSKPAN